MPVRICQLSTLIQGLKKLRIQDGLSHKAIPSIKPLAPLPGPSALKCFS